MMATDAVADLKAWIEQMHADDLEHLRTIHEWLNNGGPRPDWVDAESAGSYPYKLGVCESALGRAIVLIDHLERRAAQS